LAEMIKYWRIPALPHLELLRATYVEQQFARHIHEGYAVGVIERGALAFSYRGAHVMAPAGSINLVVPGEAHDGHAATGVGWTYRMFYLGSDLMERAAAEVDGGRKTLPFFSSGVIDDNDMARRIAALHRRLERPELSQLEQETLLTTLLTEFVLRHAKGCFSERRRTPENQAVKKARDYIEAYSNQQLSLVNLAALCGLSPYYLIRVFTRSIGVPPHVYQKQVRIRRAKRLLDGDCSVAAAALETGFADQSHFTRQFKQITGLTPGQYRNNVQDDFPKCTLQ
jgi:AraC-like DNA-binding protein